MRNGLKMATGIESGALTADPSNVGLFAVAAPDLTREQALNS
jgi:hypothetical protein